MTKRPSPTRPARPARLGEAAGLLPLLGFFLWMPPMIGLFRGPGRILDIPLIIVWLFGVWLGLIVAALWLARRLVSDEGPEEQEDTGAAPDSGPTAPDRPDAWNALG